jgi:hypothetical protein
MLISGELSAGHWVSFNAIPTTAHIIFYISGFAGVSFFISPPP